MLTLDDCIALAELTEEEIDAIAEHEHLTEMAALELGNWLVHSPEGERCIRRMIADDIDAARRCGDARRSAQLVLVLQRFIEGHPACT